MSTPRDWNFWQAAGLWPTENLSHLAPRAGMMCDGGAFKRLMRIDAGKLKVNSLEGINLLVSTVSEVFDC